MEEAGQRKNFKSPPKELAAPFEKKNGERPATPSGRGITLFVVEITGRMGLVAPEPSED